MASLAFTQSSSARGGGRSTGCNHTTSLYFAGTLKSRNYVQKRCSFRYCASATSLSESSRSVIILPGLGNNAADYENLAGALRGMHELHVEVASVSRLDWARNAAGLLDPAYYSGNLEPRPTVDWYLQRVEDAVRRAREVCPDRPITLLTHSAGGWLGRLFMLDFGTEAYGIDRFVSLGSPHLPPPEGTIDQTRGILRVINERAPGAFHPTVRYVTVAGAYIQGAPLLGPGPWQCRVVGAGYKQVCGKATAWGDGVVPVMSAHLEGAIQVTLKGIYHSPLGADEGGSAASDAEEELSPIAAAIHLEESYEASNSSPGNVVNDGAERSEHRVEEDPSPAEIEEAAAAFVPRGARLWYGSDVVLAQWVGLLSSDVLGSSREIVSGVGVNRG